MGNQKEIRFTLPENADYDLYEDFQRLCIINGEREGAGIARIVRAEVDANVEKLRDERGKLHWVDQPTLIRELEKQNPPIKTNPQTLYNYRNAGKMDGLYGSDGGKGLLYHLRRCILFFREIQAAPRERPSPAKADA